jgi:hypothetical protein
MLQTSSRKLVSEVGVSPLYVLLVIGNLVDEDSIDEGRGEKNKRFEA